MTNVRFRNIYLDNHSHFCTASVVEFLPLLRDEEACRIVLNSWQKQRQRYSVLIVGFVIMPEHIHILVRGQSDNVRKFVQYSLAQSSRELQLDLRRKELAGNKMAALWLKVLHEHANGAADGKVWKERFRCIALDREDAVRQKLKYIHSNPVKRELVTEAEAWIWSSYGHYYGDGCVIDVDTALAAGTYVCVGLQC